MQEWLEVPDLRSPSTSTTSRTATSLPLPHPHPSPTRSVKRLKVIPRLLMTLSEAESRNGNFPLCWDAVATACMGRRGEDGPEIGCRPSRPHTCRALPLRLLLLSPPPPQPCFFFNASETLTLLLEQLGLIIKLLLGGGGCR